MARIDDLLDRQTEALDRVTGREAKRFLTAYKRAGRELTADLVTVTTDDQQQRLRIMLAQVRSGQLQLQKTLDEELGGSIQRHEERALKDLVGVIAKAEPLLGETAGGIEVAALQRLTGDRSLALHTFSTQRYTQDVIGALQREIVQSTIQGETIDKLEKRLRGALKGKEHRAWLIARMELSRAYNDAELRGVLEANRTLPGGMMKKIHETADRRNHPFSRAAHGVTAEAATIYLRPSYMATICIAVHIGAK